MRTEDKVDLAKKLAGLMDTKFKFLGIKFGLDPILDAVPGAGTILTTVISFYIVFLAKEIGVSRWDIFKMIKNILIDFLIGLVPVAGAIGSVFYRANKNNLKIMEKYINEDQKNTPKD